MLHLILLKFAEGVADQARWQGASEAVMPIDWVELPSSTGDASITSIADGASSVAKPVQAAAPSASTPISAEASSKSNLEEGLDYSDHLANSKTDSSVPDLAVSAPSQAKLTTPAPAPLEATESSALENRDGLSPPSPTPSEPEAEPARQLQARQSDSQPEAEPLQEPQLQDNPPQPNQSQPVVERPLPLLNPSPLIVTQRIDVPVPDVTETLPTPTDQPIEPIIAEIVVPSELTASLTTASPETSDPPLDEAAYPKQEVQTFAANSTSSPCVVSPEAVPFLGKTVAMQVMTDELGQVVDTVTQESSQSTAYDELATCLVKNWEFEPAIAQGQPIATDGLVVRITIEADG